MSAATAPAPTKPEASRHALPDPGEQVPTLAWPTVGVFTIALTLFAAGTWTALDHSLPRGVTIAMNAAACFAMFTVLHDASHYSISSKRWVNSLCGRLAMLFVSPAMSFPGFGFIHIEHHRHSNHDDHDPDTFASHGKWWQLPFRWAAMDISYVDYYARNLRRRPRAELIETGILMTAIAAGIAAAIATGTIWMLAVIYLIPERISMTVLAWWFDWLPHHGLEDTQRENRYRATRNRVGMEWLFTPLLLSQNYHLVHHLHPSVPFYRYIATWKRNEEAYLERDAAIGTVFGKQLNPDEYREWKELNRKLLRVLPVRTPKGSSATHAVFHRVPVSRVDRLTDDSVAITFGIPENLRDEFRFTAGQHLTVRTDLGGKDVRRNYSICSPATGDTLRIAVKQIPGGAFSTYAAEELKPGDTLELMTPTGRFGAPLEPLQSKHYVAIAAGSGITPILSVLATTLEIETESRFTLIYGNRTAESTMFREELAELEARYSDRLEIRHVRSRERDHAAELSGRIDAAKLEAWMAEDLAPDGVDEWFMCGPVELVTMARDTLVENGVDAQHIHLELFFGYEKSAVPQHSHPAAAVTVRLSGSEQTAALEPGETILEAALRAGSDTPYACMGGACGTCRARVVSGSVEMDQNFALGKADLDAGYVLTCQSHPTGPEVTVDSDA